MQKVVNLTVAPGGIALILDSIDVVTKLPIQIIEGYYIRKAEKKEIERIKKHLAEYKDTDLNFEFEYEKIDKEHWKLNRLEPEKWKYYVIHFEGNNKETQNIEYACYLIKNELILGFTLFSEKGALKGGIGYDSTKIANYFADRNFGYHQGTKIINEDDIKEITANYELIVGLDSKRYPKIKRAISEFDHTKHITERSPMKVLSYFTIIESVLTHIPKPYDSTDSITRQITAKMCLLSKRFKRKVNYNTYFPGYSDLDKIWKKLYEYRSYIAHGEDIDFKNNFKDLVSDEIIKTFLMENIKLMIIYALYDPELITDLQKC